MKAQPGPASSDHHVTVGISKDHKEKLEFRNVEVCKLSNMDLAKFGSDVALTCENMLHESDLDTLVKGFSTVLKEILDGHAPKFTKQFTSRTKYP